MTLKISRKRLFSSVLAVLMLSWQLVIPANASAHHNDTPPPPNSKITICHATGSTSNPYQQIEVDESAADGVAGNSGQKPDHYGEHTDPVFNAAMQQGDSSGDIIPPIQNVHAGLNWTAEGQAIWNNGCDTTVPTGSIEVNKKVDTDGDGWYKNGNGMDFSWNLDNETAVYSMGDAVEDVAIGSHTITENPVNGYVFTGWYYSDDFSWIWNCNNPRGTTLPVNVEVKKNKTTKITLCNQVKKGSITIIKDAQPNSGNDFAFEIDKRQSSWDKNFILDDDGNTGNKYSNTRTFEDLTAGTFDVTEAYAHGWNLSDITCSEGATISVDKAHRKVSITLEPGDSVTCTFVNQKPAKLKIVKDASPQSRQNFTFNSDQLGSFTLDDDGDNNDRYSNKERFIGLNPGTYTIAEEAVDGWKLDDITCDTENYNVTWETAQLEVALNPGDDVTCIFKNVEQNAISGFKYEDTNGNGWWDEDEPTISGWTITLTRYDQEQPAVTTQTDEGGYYRFDNLDQGHYRVCEEQRTGWIQTTYPYCYGILFERPGQERKWANFGNFELGQVSGIEFNDQNGNGEWEEDEPTLKDWTITLYQEQEEEEESNEELSLMAFSALAASSSSWNAIQTAQTNASGYYSFANLAPGTYKVCQTPKNNWSRTYPATDDCHYFSITTSGQIVTADFGNKVKPQVLGASAIATIASIAAVSPAQLVNTGASVTKQLLFGLIILSVVGAAHFLTTRRKDYAK